MLLQGPRSHAMNYTHLILLVVEGQAAKWEKVRKRCRWRPREMEGRKWEVGRRDVESDEQ